MQSRLRTAIYQLIGLAIVVALLAGVARLFLLAIEEGSTFGAALVAALATVAAAAVVRGFEKRRVMEAIRREQLGAVYTELAQALHGREVPVKEREKLVLDFMRKGLMYASPGTLKAFRTWQSKLPTTEQWAREDFRPNSLRYEEFVKAMRKDLGISNWNLGDGDLARLGINDYDDYP